MSDPKDVLRTEFSEPFVQGMRDRMVVSFFKYGPLEDAYPHKVDAVASLLVRLRRYLGPERFDAAVGIAREGALATEPGNTEWLMDVGNFAMIEFMRPRHPAAHFRGTDSRESPGRVDKDGDQTQRRNADLGSDACPKCGSPSTALEAGRKCSSPFCMYRW